MLSLLSTLSTLTTSPSMSLSFSRTSMETAVSSSVSASSFPATGASLTPMMVIVQVADVVASLVSVAV